MKTKTWVHILVAAALVIIGGAVIGFAEQTTLKVMIEDDDSINVDVNGEVTVVNLDDLADGEERVIEAGEHTIVVKRVGDEFKITLDGNDFGAPGCAANHAENFVWVGDDGESVGVQKKVVVIKADDATGVPCEKKIMISADGEVLSPDSENFDVFIKKLEGALGEETIDIEVLKERLGEHMVVNVNGETHGSPMIVKHHTVAKDTIRYVCPEDKTELSLKKDQATQESYLCPVCGRAMEKAPELKVMHFVTTIEEKDEAN